jgi:peptidoglycan lytic transglycosylase G
LSDPPKVVDERSPKEKPSKEKPPAELRSRSQSASSAVPSSTAGLRRLPSVNLPGANLPDPNLPKDTQSTSASDSAVPKRSWFPSETMPRASQRVTASSPQIISSPQITSSPHARPNAGASWSNEPEPPIQSEVPLPNLVGAGPMRLDPSQRVAPRSQGAARMPVDAGEPYPPISGRPQDALGAPFVDQKRITPRSPRAALEPEQVTVPIRRSERARHPLVVAGNAFFTLLILAVIAGGIAFAVGKTRFEAPGPLEREKAVNIPPRMGVLDIADLLRREGVIDEHPMIFVGGLVWRGAYSDLKSGEYVFSRHASVSDVVDTMVGGKVVQHAITLPEGWTSEQIVQHLLKSEILTGNIKDIPREGTLLPESYRFARGTSREQVIQRLQREHRRVLQEVWERRSPDLPVKTPEQLVILASIIEKETGKPEERTRVAAVFVNRLKQRKRLESDPTIIYGLVGGKGSLGHGITRSERETPTPYNTYMIDGLPPGPIANPGRASLEAAANPARTKEMFFVADGTGGHVFSETFDQHQRNVQRLRALEREDRSTAAATSFQPEDPATGIRPVPPAAPKAQPKRNPSVTPPAPSAANNANAKKQ